MSGFAEFTRCAADEDDTCCVLHAIVSCADSAEVSSTEEERTCEVDSEGVAPLSRIHVGERCGVCRPDPVVYDEDANGTAVLRRCVGKEFVAGAFIADVGLKGVDVGNAG